MEGGRQGRDRNGRGASGMLRAGALTVGLAAACLAAPAGAQTQSFEEFEAQVQAAAGEIARYQQILQNPDVRIQYEAVKLMLKSNDPALVRIAREHALFSTNPVLRNVAVKAIFDAQPNLRVVVTSTGEESADVLRWIAQAGGSHDGKTGSFIFKVGEVRENCWIHYNDNCRLQLAGTTVQFRNYGNSPDRAQANLNLGPDGILRGVVFSDEGSAQMAIDLKE